MKQRVKITVAAALLLLAAIQWSFVPQAQSWKKLSPKNETEVRGENAFVAVGDLFYLLGGRKKETMYTYNPKTNEWNKVANVPMEMHHFQAVAFNNELYVLGALTGDYPHETPIANIYIYNPKQNQWRKGAEIPANRLRGSAGVTVYQNKIYLVCGIQDGHWDGHVTWLDEYDPKTDKWRQLPDAPHARDHVQAAIIDNQLVMAGGRLSSQKIGKVLELTVPEVDVYDFKKGTWRSLPAAQNIPTQRAGCTSVTLGNQVLVIGGESTQLLAHNQTEAFDVKTNSWQTLDSLRTGRHGTQALVYKNKVYICGGAGNHGGGPELNSIEVFE